MINIEFIINENRAVAYDDENEIGECEFEEIENVWNIVHTEVDSKYQGQGIAKKLVLCVIDNSKKFEKTVLAECSYAKKILNSK